jgi:hypothetical protein
MTKVAGFLVAKTKRREGDTIVRIGLKSDTV